MCHPAPEPAPSSSGVTQRVALPGGPDPGPCPPPGSCGPVPSPLLGTGAALGAGSCNRGCVRLASSPLSCLFVTVGPQLGVRAVWDKNCFFPCERVVPAPPGCDVAGDPQEHLLLQQQCPNAFQMGSALLCVLGPAASPGWSLQPALGMRCSRPRGPGLGTCWGDCHHPNASGQCRALGGPLDGVKRAAVGATPAWAPTGEGGMLHLGSLRERPDRLSRLCRRGQPCLGRSRRLGPGDAARVTPRKGRAAGGAPAPHLPPRTASPVWPVAPGQRRARPAGFARRQAAHDPRRGAKG